MQLFAHSTIRPYSTRPFSTRPFSLPLLLIWLASLFHAAQLSASTEIQIPDNIDMMLSLGAWQEDKASGQIRLIALTKRQDSADSVYQLIWLEKRNGEEPRVKAQADIQEWTGEFITSAAQLNLNDATVNRALLIQTINRGTNQPTDWVLYPGKPGTYRLFEDEVQQSTRTATDQREQLLIYYVRPTF